MQIRFVITFQLEVEKLQLASSISYMNSSARLWYSMKMEALFAMYIFHIDSVRMLYGKTLLMVAQDMIQRSKRMRCVIELCKL